VKEGEGWRGEGGGKGGREEGREGGREGYLGVDVGGFEGVHDLRGGREGGKEGGFRIRGEQRRPGNEPKWVGMRNGGKGGREEGREGGREGRRYLVQGKMMRVARAF
jgi:hypothetical protein